MYSLSKRPYTFFPIQSLVIVALALCGGCQKESGPTLVEGQVVDRTTGQPLAGATVEVYGQSGGGFSGYTGAGSSSTAGADGRFSLHFEASAKTHYVLMASSALGHYTLYAEAPSLDKGTRNKGLRVPVQAPGWVRLQLIDEPPRNRVAFYFSGYTGGGDILIGPRDTTLIRSMPANIPGQVLWELRDDRGQTTRHSRDLTISSLDTATVTIRF